MQALRAVWNRFSRRERYLLGVALVLLVLLGFYYLVAEPFAAEFTRVREELDLQREFLRKNLEFVALDNLYGERRKELLKRYMSMRETFIRDQNESLAAARFQEEVQKLAKMSGIQVRSSDSQKSRPLSAPHNLILLTVRFDLKASQMKQLRDFLHALEQRSRYKFQITRLEVQTTGGSVVHGAEVSLHVQAIGEVVSSAGPEKPTAPPAAPAEPSAPPGAATPG